jgi:hypothetical protein
VPPIDHLAYLVALRLQANCHRRTAGRVLELVAACPLHTDWLTWSGHCNESGIERDVVGTVMPVATGSLNVHDRNPGLIESKYPRKLLTKRKDALRMRPHKQIGIHKARDGAGRADRRMSNEGPREHRFETPWSRGTVASGNHCCGDGSMRF